jgi:tetratricopeptide (TPR) repeat protein
MPERTRVALLLMVAVLVYTNTLFNDFTFDDEMYILRNQTVHHISPQGFFRPTRHNNVLRPVTFASFALNWALEGAQPFGYHLVNLLLHAAVVLLLYLLFRTLLASEPRAATIAFAGGLLFAVHPIHTEAVASIAARSELLAAGFLLAAWLLHLSDRWISALVCLLLALMSKESAAIFLPLVLAGDYVRGKFATLRRYVLVAGVIILYLGAFWTIKGGRFGQKGVSFLDNPLVTLPAGLRILNALRIAWKYIALQVYPATFSVDYSYNAIALYAKWRYAVLALVGTVLVLGLWIWALCTRRNAWILAGAIYLVGFSVTANLLVATGTIMGERLAYLPSAGFCLFIAAVWIRLESYKPWIAWVLFAVLMAALGTRTVVRNRDWRNNLTLYSAAVRAVPGSAKMHADLGTEYLKQDRLSAARAEFQTALRIFPDFSEAMENYGIVEGGMGHDQEARQLLQKALSLTVQGSMDHDFMAVNLATQLMKMGENNDALKLLNQTISDFPGYAWAWSNRAVIRYGRGEVAEARADAEAALHLDPANTQAQNLLHTLNAEAPLEH